MKFGDMPVGEAEGAILAHSIRLTKGSLKKGRVLSAEDIATLREAGRETVVAARLDADDVGEDEAAGRVAAACTGDYTETSAPFTGRANLFAKAPGVAVLDAARLDRINLVHEAVTIATVPPFAAVERRDMLATVKVIPFAAPERIVAECEAIACDGGPLISVAPFMPIEAALILTKTEGMKQSILDKTIEVTRSRIEGLGGTLDPDNVVQCDHETRPIARAVKSMMDRGCGLVMISGASAIVDRRDVIPAAIVESGGLIEHFGMPVDPGNLMLMARHGVTPVIGLPGCARSPLLNGLDWVLQRIFAGLPLGPQEIMRMGSGGLLKDSASRPMPRAFAISGKETDSGAAVARKPNIAALILAAGQSSRMGPVNKLLADVSGTPMLVRTVEAVLASQADSATVVTGHQQDEVRKVLEGRKVTFVHNPDYAEGLSTSLKHGLAALGDEIDGVLVCLGDMPGVTASHLDRLIAAFDPVEGRSICVPTVNGKRGNPVLWARKFFAEMAEVAGDVGARHLIGEHAEEVCEVAMNDTAVLDDLDTPDALAAYTARRQA